MDIDKVQAFPSTPGAYCESFMCFQPATWTIGRPDGPGHICLHLCEEHFAELQESMAPEPEVHVVESMEKFKQKIWDIEYRKSGWYQLPDGETKFRGPEDLRQILIDYVSAPSEEDAEEDYHD